MAFRQLQGRFRLNFLCMSPSHLWLTNSTTAHRDIALHNLPAFFKRRTLYKGLRPVRAKGISNPFIKLPVSFPHNPGIFTKSTCINPVIRLNLGIVSSVKTRVFSVSVGLFNQELHGYFNAHEILCASSPLTADRAWVCNSAFKNHHAEHLYPVVLKYITQADEEKLSILGNLKMAYCCSKY